MQKFHPSGIFLERVRSGVRGESLTRYANDPLYRAAIRRIAVRVVWANVGKLRFALQDFDTPEEETTDRVWAIYRPAACALLAILHNEEENVGAERPPMIPLPRFKFAVKPLSGGGTPETWETASLDPSSIADRTIWADALTEVNALYEPFCPRVEITPDGYRFTRHGEKEGYAVMYWRDLILAGLSDAIGAHLTIVALDASNRVETLELAYAEKWGITYSNGDEEIVLDPSEVALNEELSAEALSELHEELVQAQMRRNKFDEILADYDRLVESMRIELESLPAKA